MGDVSPSKTYKVRTVSRLKNVWIADDVLNLIIDEANNKAPLETGGILAGYCSADDRDVVITKMVGPGSRALHRQWTFRPDYSYHRSQIEKIFDESNRTISYLGDWHTHPGNPAYLSWLDKRALRNITKFQGNYMDHPIMLILGGTDSNRQDKWTPRVWSSSPHESRLPWAKWEYIPLDLIIMKTC